MSDDVLQLFEEFTARYAAGELPDPRPYLDRAGPQADRLAALIERYVESAPRPAPSSDEVAALQSWLERGEPTLVTLRVRKGLKRDAVVDTLLRGLGITPEKREKLAGYYHQLENGMLDTSRVDASVVAILAKVLGVSPSELIALPGRPLVPEQVYFRRTTTGPGEVPAQVASITSDRKFPAAGKPEHDEVDDLFLGPAA